MALYALLDTTVSPSRVSGLCSPSGETSLAHCTFLSADQIANAQPVPSDTQVRVGYVFANGIFSPPTPTTPPPTPTLTQQAAAMLDAGVAVIFTTSTTLNATYKTDLDTQVNIFAEVTYLGMPGNTTPLFIGGDTELTLHDKDGIARMMTVPVFAAFQTAYANWVKLVKTVREGNTGTLPDVTITVAA